MPYVATRPTLYRPKAKRGGMRGYRGLGQTPGTETSEIEGAISGAGQALAPVTGGLSNLLSIAAGPIAGLIEGCGSTCTQATSVVNQAAALMQQNLNAYLAIPAPRTAAEQSQAQANFNTLWQALVNACSSPSLKSAGQNCISQREEGACAYQASPGGWSQSANGAWTYTGYGPNGSGTSCWNFFVGYLDPITTDPTVGAEQDFNAISSQVGASTPESVLSSIPSWVWLAAAAVVVFMVVK